MYQSVLFVLCVVVMPVLGTEVCLCTDSDVVIRKLPSLTAPVTGKLVTGTCLNVSQFERIGQWLKVYRDGIQTGYVLESEGAHQRNCQDDRSKRTSLYCEFECPTSCCDGHSNSYSHHHGIHCGISCDRHNCCGGQAPDPVWSHWGLCSVTCGIGIRTRHCTHYCNSTTSTHEVQQCQQSACPLVNHASDHMCDKVSVVQAVAFQVPENCSDDLSQSYTQFVTQYCKAPSSLADWIQGSRVSTNCDTVPVYSPVSTFSQHDVISGVFAGCLSNQEFKVIASRCGASPQIMHISSANASFNQFHRVKW